MIVAVTPMIIWIVNDVACDLGVSSITRIAVMKETRHSQ